MTIPQQSEIIFPRMVELRRTFHRYPELAFEEKQTAAVIMAELRLNSQEPYRNGWQFVSCTAVPVEARMWAKNSGEETCAASSRRLRSFHAGCTLRNKPGCRPVPYQPTPKPSPLVVVAPRFIPLPTRIAMRSGRVNAGAFCYG